MKRSISQHVSKHTPLRTCVACHTIKAKRELARLVRSLDGAVEIDPGGKKPGRGVYLCPVRKCWQTGLKGGRIEHALRTTLADKNREQLIKYAESLGEGEQEPGRS